eukprot:scaffold22222_cov20-Prasinocladus_malaysianus.AAC.1
MESSLHKRISACSMHHLRPCFSAWKQLEDGFGDVRLPSSGNDALQPLATTKAWLNSCKDPRSSLIKWPCCPCRKLYEYQYRVYRTLCTECNMAWGQLQQNTSG